MQDRCKLCGVVATLVESHIIPRWVFRMVVNDVIAPSGPRQPVYVERGNAVLSSKQPTEPMLCRACEARFSRDEGYAKRIVAQSDGSFPFAADLDPSPDGDARIAIATRPDVPSLARFAASLFWRAGESRTYSRTTLGRYGAAFRDYLLGIAPFPDRAVLVVSVLQPRRDIEFILRGSVSDFASTNMRGHHVHAIVLRGMTFHLYVGDVPQLVTRHCFARTGRVLISDGKALFESLVRDFGGATPRGTLARRSQ